MISRKLKSFNGHVGYKILRSHNSEELFIALLNGLLLKSNTDLDSFHWNILWGSAICIKTYEDAQDRSPWLPHGYHHFCLSMIFNGFLLCTASSWSSTWADSQWFGNTAKVLCDRSGSYFCSSFGQNPRRMSMFYMEINTNNVKVCSISEVFSTAYRGTQTDVTRSRMSSLANHV